MGNNGNGSGVKRRGVRSRSWRVMAGSMRLRAGRVMWRLLARAETIALLWRPSLGGPQVHPVLIGHNLGYRKFFHEWAGGLGAADRPEKRGPGRAGVQVEGVRPVSSCPRP